LSLSHLEGFNIPIVEAMSQGRPSVVSDLPVHREIAQDGAVYLSQNDPAEAAKLMYELLTAPEQWNAKSEVAWLRSQAFTPRALALRVTDVYRSAC
jgi:glycosyltransferase involved in cell wall biosynthesis